MNTYKPKLLLLSTADDIGGMERIVAGLAREFTARGWSVQNVFPQSPNSTALLAWCRDQGVGAETNAAVLDAAAPHTNRALLALWTFVRKRNPDVVNLHYGDNFISLKDVLAARLAGRQRCVITVHHPTPWDRANRRKRWMTYLASHLVPAVAVVSNATRDVLLEAGVPAGKIRLIPCGVRVPATLPTRTQARTRLGLPLDAFVVGSLARLVPHKGIADLLEAAALVPDPCGAMVVSVAGDGPERSALEERARSLLGDRAVFLGRILDTADLYAAADVFVLPSYMEGFGLVYVEAAFHGVPSIGTHVGGIPDVIVDGETGLLVPPGNHTALAAAIQKLRDDPPLRLRLGEAARTRAHAEFTEARMADRYARIFQL